MVPSGKLRLPTVHMANTQAEGVALVQILQGFLGLAETKKLNTVNQRSAKPSNKTLVEYVVT